MVQNVYKTELEQLLGRKVLWEDALTNLMRLLDMRVDDHQKEIIEMSRRASEVSMIEYEL